MTSVLAIREAEQPAAIPALAREAALRPAAREALPRAGQAAALRPAVQEALPRAALAALRPAGREQAVAPAARQLDAARRVARLAAATACKLGDSLGCALAKR